MNRKSLFRKFHDCVKSQNMYGSIPPKQGGWRNRPERIIEYSKLPIVLGLLVTLLVVSIIVLMKRPELMASHKILKVMF